MSELPPDKPPQAAQGEAPAKRPRREIRARRTSFGRRAVRQGRRAASTRSGLTSPQTDYTHNTGTRGYTSTRSILAGSASSGALARARVAWIRGTRVVRWRIRHARAWLSATVTGLGLSLAALVVVAFVLGYVFAWLELVVVAYTGLALLVIGVFFLLGRNTYDVGLSMDSERVVVGDRATATLQVKNPSRFRLLPVKAEVPVGQGLAEFYFGALRPKGETSRVFAVPTTRRGVVRVGPVRTVRADPIGLVRREYVWTSFLELFIHPTTIPIPATSTGLIRDLEGNPTRDLTNSDVSFHALREYAPGDDRRYIHWKSTARTGQLMVRQFEETRRSHLVIALSLASADYHSEEEFELAVSVAGSLGIRAIRDAREVSVVASELTPEFAPRVRHAVRRLNALSRARLLDDLARVEHAALASPIVDLAKAAADAITGVSVAIFVCGSEPTAGQLRAASTAFPPGIEVLAVVCNPGIVPSYRRVGELSVLTVGYLDDLQKSLARSAAA